MSARYVRQSSVDLDDINYEPNRYPTAQDDATGGLADADGHDAAGPLFSGGVGHGQRRTRWQRVVDAVKYPKGLKIVPVVSLLVSLAGTLVTRLGENYTAVQVLMAAAAVRFGFVAAHVAVFEHRPFSSRGDRALLLAVAVFGAAAMLCWPEATENKLTALLAFSNGNAVVEKKTEGRRCSCDDEAACSSPDPSPHRILIAAAPECSFCAELRANPR